MPTLTAELRQEIEKTGDAPVRLEDPETHNCYVVRRSTPGVKILRPERHA